MRHDHGFNAELPQNLATVATRCAQIAIETDNSDYVNLPHTERCGRSHSVRLSTDRGWIRRILDVCPGVHLAVAVNNSRTDSER